MEAKIKAILASKATNEAKCREIMALMQWYADQREGRALLQATSAQWKPQVGWPQ